MNVLLRSDRITLLSEYDYGECHDELWRLFRRTAVEPGQASSPEFISFADECLLCAHIVVNETEPVRTEDGGANNGESPFDIHPPEENAQMPPPPSGWVSPSPAPVVRKVGYIYLHAGPANLPAGEANIGVIVKQDMRRSGYAREAVQLVLRWAFEELKFHRVQALILDTPFKDKSLRLFIGMGFAHEGTRRRAVYQPEGEGMAGVWKDVTHLAMLDTEWMLRLICRRDDPAADQPVVSVWDEMFARHSREREELLKWEESHGRVRRSSSTETLRESARNAAPDMAYLTDDAASISEPSIGGSAPPSPRPNLVVTWEEDTHMADALDADEFSQTWEEVMETTIAARRHRECMGSSLLEPSSRNHVLALPSIPSTRASEVNPQSPLTIATPSTPRDTPPSSPSPSASSSVYGSWPEDEDEDNWLPRDTPGPLPVNVSPQFVIAYGDPYPLVRLGSSGGRSRSSSLSTSSADSWSDAQSSIDEGSSSWDLISSTSADSPPGDV